LEIRNLYFLETSGGRNGENAHEIPKYKLL
jgi:hypothetical protein